MGVEAILRTETGEQVRGLSDPAGGTFDSAGNFDHALPGYFDRSFMLLRYVDPYGDTIFNSCQMPDLLEDIRVLLARDLERIERRGVERLRTLAETCRDGSHRYLWFIGD